MTTTIIILASALLLALIGGAFYFARKEDRQTQRMKSDIDGILDLLQRNPELVDNCVSLTEAQNKLRELEKNYNTNADAKEGEQDDIH